MNRVIILVVLLLSTSFIGCAQSNVNQVKEQSLKYQRLMALIDAFYVDTVNMYKLTEDAIVKVLSDLDPHSVYVSKDELEEMNEPLEGGFFGIGIQFTLLRDSLMVVSVVPGGPSERVGLKAGDRIITVDGENIAGIKLTNSGVRKRLKGEKGTKVEVGVLRDNNDLLSFKIIRDKIPIYSLDASYMLDKTTGYIRVSRFSATTTEEFDKALNKLQAEGMKDLVLDLQGNVGGYMGAATDMCDHFLGNDKLMVYTEGISSSRREERATAKGLFEKGRLLVLIDGNSASASEIVSGAVQDWDRGVIVGRRSFGKGLVQRQFPLTDGTMIRLTTSHYYTPSGRSIQKPYDEDKSNYRAELYHRYESGELLSADSMEVNDSLKYLTLVKKRVVYGGGGIIPDIFVPIDTGLNYLYYNRLIGKGVINEYVVSYVDKNRKELNSLYSDFKEFKKNFIVTDAMLEKIVEMGEKAGVEKDEKLYPPMIPIMKRQVKALVARDIWDMNEMYQILNEENTILNAAYKALKNGEYEKVIK
ncbi:S41 family peptidase [Odoribacter sp. OttesenSCG-928-J03]|nr:S41 family peptidase [Odoribacter sp. OttesenSCG-928-J03]MDL2283102.1 S41 family peptidase [Odoribacter sp. OttesenSCG-928-G04]MDL2331140.1 S41 family peptidase [Odoribacter sp. OttesenSCG-928-A06]